MLRSPPREDDLRLTECAGFDLFSVPQADQALQAQAIASIPAYVAKSSFFLVLVGPWKHENGSLRDVRVWTSRGWCRVEVLCNALSPQAKPVIVMQSPSDVVTHGPLGLPERNYILDPVVSS